MFLILNQVSDEILTLSFCVYIIIKFTEPNKLLFNNNNNNNNNNKDRLVGLVVSMSDY